MLNNPNNFKVIVFDVFGTLIKAEPKRSPYKKLMKWLKDQGRRPACDDAAVIMSTFGGFTEVADRFGKDIPAPLLLELNEDLSDDLQAMTLYEDTISTLEKLKQSGFRLALCSNLAKPYGEAVFSILPDLEAYAWSYEVGSIKPEPEIYQYLIDQLNCNPKEVLFIGDTPLADVTGPMAFGMSARLIDRKKGQKISDILADLL